MLSPLECNARPSPAPEWRAVLEGTGMIPALGQLLDDWRAEQAGIHRAALPRARNDRRERPSIQVAWFAATQYRTPRQVLLASDLKVMRGAAVTARAKIDDPSSRM